MVMLRIKPILTGVLLLCAALHIHAGKLAVSEHMESMLYKIKGRKTEARLDAVFHKLRNTYGFNGAVLLSENNHVIYKKAYVRIFRFEIA